MLTESTISSLTMSGSGANRHLGVLYGATVEMAQDPPGRKTVGVPSKFSMHASPGLGVGVAAGGVGVGNGVTPGDAVGDGVGVGGAIPFPRSYTSISPRPVLPAGRSPTSRAV